MDRRRLQSYLINKIELKKFTICDPGNNPICDYYYEEGMTWNDFINSSYNVIIESRGEKYFLIDEYSGGVRYMWDMGFDDGSGNYYYSYPVYDINESNSCYPEDTISFEQYKVV